MQPKNWSVYCEQKRQKFEVIKSTVSSFYAVVLISLCITVHSFKSGLNQDIAVCILIYILISFQASLLHICQIIDASSFVE